METPMKVTELPGYRQAFIRTRQDDALPIAPGEMYDTGQDKPDAETQRRSNSRLC
jgi:hypothetical protein